MNSMTALTSKTSSQSFFLRVLKVIIQLREAALLAIKKAKKEAEQQQAKKEAEQKRESEEKKTEETKEGEPAKEGQSTAMEVETEKRELVDTLESLSDQLILNSLWDTLSNCLKELAETPDHHAVLVLQVGLTPMQLFFDFCPLLDLILFCFSRLWRRSSWCMQP